MGWIYNQLRKQYYRNKEDPLQALLKRGLTVGMNFGMMEEVKIDHSHCWHIKIGDDVTLAPRVHILAHDASTKKKLGFTRIGKVDIGSRVFVGAGTIILPGVTIGNDVVIGAGSVVAKDVQDGQVVAGNPARFICPTEQYMERRQMEMKNSPHFDASYTLGQGVSDKLKQQMNTEMSSRIGYVE